MFTGLLIKESLKSEEVLDLVKIEKVDIWQTKYIPEYWTAISFTSIDDNFPEKLSECLMPFEDCKTKWFCDFIDENFKYIVLNSRVLKYRLGNAEEKEFVCEQLLKMGVIKEQINWSE